MKKGFGSTIREARYLVSIYYKHQKHRIILENQLTVLKQEKLGKFIAEGVSRNLEEINLLKYVASRLDLENAIDKIIAERENKEFTEERIAKSLIKLKWDDFLAVSHFYERYVQLENDVKKELDYFSMSTALGEACRSVYGIGPVITAGLIAHIDIEKAPNVSHIWSFGGLDPTQVWYKKTKIESIVNIFKKTKKEFKLLEAVSNELSLPFERAIKRMKDKPLTPSNIIKQLSKRPYNAMLKTLAYKISDSFVRSSPDKSWYRRFYEIRKAYETDNNKKGEYREQALIKKNKVGVDTEARKWYEKGLLPPGHIDSRVRRWIAKLFLSHFHSVSYMLKYLEEPPSPYAVQFLGHRHIYEPEDAGWKY